MPGARVAHSVSAPDALHTSQVGPICLFSLFFVLQYTHMLVPTISSFRWSRRLRRHAEAALPADQAVAGGGGRGQHGRGGPPESPPGRSVARTGGGRVPPPARGRRRAKEGNPPHVVAEEGRREVLGAPQHVVRLKFNVCFW